MTTMTKQTDKERVQALKQQVEKGIYTLFQPEKYGAFLTTMGRFHHYSLNNQILVYMQRPDATMVANFDKWRDKYKRSVMKGEKGIRIIAPTVTKKMVPVTQTDAAIDPSMQNGSGSAPPKEVTYTSYKVASVFDVAQTEGMPLAPTIAGNMLDYDAFLEAAKQASPVPVWFAHLPDNADGSTSGQDRQIIIPEDMSMEDKSRALIREITRTKFDVTQQMQADDQSAVTVPTTEAVESASVAYAVCKYFGIESEDGFGYITAWAWDKDPTELRSTLETIRKATDSLIYTIEKNYREVCAAHGTVLENTAAGTLQAVPEAAEQPAEQPETASEQPTAQEYPPEEAASYEQSEAAADLDLFASLGIEVTEYQGNRPRDSASDVSPKPGVLAKLHQYRDDSPRTESSPKIAEMEL